MTPLQHNRILAIAFGVFAAIFGLTFLLLLLVSLGVFVALGISFANETGDANQAGIGILGGSFAVVFYVVLGLIFVLPLAVASRKLWKQRRSARTWGIIAAIVIIGWFPLGTFLAVYTFWFLLGPEGRTFYSDLDPAGA
jgi:hypothetical protein